MTANRSRSYLIAGVFICVAGAVFFSTKAVVVKLAYRDTDVDAVTLLALRMMFSLPFFVVSAVLSSSKADNVRFTSRQWLQVAVVGCLGYYVSSLLDFLGLQYVSAGIERLILFIYPTIVLLMTAILFKVKITRRQWLAVGITYVGLLTAFFGEARVTGSTDNSFYKGAGLIFACAITYATYLVGSGRLIPKVGASKYNSYAMTFACVAVLIHFFVTGEENLFELSGTIYLYSLVMALIGTVIPSYLVAEGIKRVGSENAAIIGSIGPVSRIIQAKILLGEPMFAAQLIGTALVIVGILLIGKGK